MADATARFQITADDKTRAAFASISKSFSGLERDFRSSLRAMNTGLSVFAGVQLKQAFRALIKNAADSNKEFAASFDQVKDAFKDLASPHSGISASTQAMRELAVTLKDPKLQAAADDFTSALIKGFAYVAKDAAHFIRQIEEIPDD